MSDELPTGRPVTHAGRAKRLLLTPKEEWQAIDAEPMATGDVYKNWVLPLAAIGPVAGLIGGVVFGHSVFGITFRPSLGMAAGMAVTSYVMAIVGTFVLALIIDALAPSFGGTKNSLQATKVAAYSATAAWLAGIFQLLPGVGLLGILGLYSIYLLYVGLPMLMRAPADKAVGYTVVSIIAAAVVFFVAGTIVGKVGQAMTPSLASMGGGALSGTVSVPGVGSVDLGKMEEATRKMEAAANNAQTAKAVAPDVLQALLPDALGAWKRTEISSSGANAGGIGGSNARASYVNGDGSLELEVTDIAAAGALAAMGAAFNVQSNRQTETGYEKTSTIDGRMTTEEWDNQSRRGKYGVLVANRFMVEARGTVPAVDTLKQAVAAIGTDKLEALAR